MNKVAETSRMRFAQLPGAALAALLAVVVGGAVHGHLTQRWGPNEELVEAAKLLDSFPERFGPWRLQRSNEMTDRVAQMLQCAGHVTRDYVNQDTGELVQMFVIVGPPGPTSVHTPEICFSSRDYKVATAPQKVAIDSRKSKHEFWKVQLRSKRPGGGDRVVYYAWTADDHWHAPDRPRFHYGGAAYLYKIQASGVPSVVGEQPDADLCNRFLDELLNSGWAPKAIGA